MLKIRLIFLVLIFMVPSLAFSASQGCASLLHKIAVDPLQNVSFKKRDIKAEISEDDGGGQYMVRLFVVANSPDNLDGNVSIGWVRLDSNAMHTYDVTQNPDNATPLNVKSSDLKNYVKSCLSKE